MTDPTPPNITFEAIADPIVDGLGFALTNPYVYDCWLPVLGPTSVGLLWHVGGYFDRHPGEPHLRYTIAVADLAGCLGIGNVGRRTAIGRHSVFQRTLQRLARYRVGRFLWSSEDEQRYGLMTHVAPLSRHQLERLPEQVRAAHERHLAHRSYRDEVEAAHP